jgi:ribosomal protection tetracycline resistance protein
LHRRTLNLGILAHVDAGKTTLTERLLYAAGVIDEIGSVDKGTTQTDSLDLERQRGITIRSAVVSFQIDDVTVNLIDTPGHPDFIAEVERVLGVLDGAVLVISAVEGVQPQTRVLMRALQRLRVPTLLFVNKIDRGGADDGRVLDAIRRRLTTAIVAMGSVDGLGTGTADFTPYGPGDRDFPVRLTEALAGQNEALLAAYVNDEHAVTYRRLRRELATQTKRGLVHPVFFGSAITGAGLAPLTAALVELLPTDAGDATAAVSGRVLKIERGASGERIAYVRLFAGTLELRDRVADDKVTGISVFHNGQWLRRTGLCAGEIGRVHGLGRARVGDDIGRPHTAGAPSTFFARPTMETVVVPIRPAERAALRVALAQLAEQDPLIDVRQDDSRHEISVSLYGEVQKEVIQATLHREFGIEVTFHESTTLCVERPLGIGEAVERQNADGNPFHATVGLRIEPGPPESGVRFRLGIDTRTVPMYVYKNVESFAQAMDQYVRASLTEGLYGWPVTDCVVTMIECNYTIADGPPSMRGPLSTAADYRRLAPIVVMRALEQAGAAICEPTVRVSIELPPSSVSPVLAMLGRLGATADAPSARGELSIVEAVLPAARVPELQRRLPGLTAGEGVLESRFWAYRPVRGAASVRARTTANPLNRAEYLMYVRS